MNKKVIDLNIIGSYLELITDLAYIKDIDGKYICCNTVYLNFIDKSKEELIGHTDYEFFPKENADKCALDESKALESNSAVDFEDTFEFDNNKIIYFKTTKQVVYDKNLDLIGVLSVSRDITELKQYQLLYKDNKVLLEKQLLKKTKDLRLFKQVIENINYGVLITTADDHNTLIYVNDEFTNITGYSKEEVIGKNCKFLQKDDLQAKEIHILKEGLKNRKKVQVEIRNYKKDGTLFYNLLSVSPVYDYENNLTNFVGIQKDITVDKKQEANMAEQAKLASMGEMIANIAHQWRQPLSVISTASTGMQLQKEFGFLSNEEFDKTCTAINENVQYLSQTIDDFKNFIKNDSPKKYFYLTRNISKFLSLVSGTIKNNEIEMILNLDDSIEINGYENELIQCLMNIFNNSKDAYVSKEEKLFFIDSYMKNKKVVIRLRDNAGGIPEDIISKVFEPYFTTKHKFQGTGLGLHMTYNLITEGMKGRIKVSNHTYTYNEKEYTGAQFIIILPYL